MTTETFAEYVAQQDARNTIQLNVRKYTLMLCDALLKNYIDYSIKSHQRSVYREVNADYHQACIEELKNGQCGYEFTVESGRKYHKIMMSANGSRSVHAFVDKKTGEVYKPASIKSPAKGVRFNLCIMSDREWLLENADWAGGYLYVR
tara:strand:- start:2297 stop:2740 length:444 start_codon:yes stop_codon:yes gene_type:complete